MKTTLVLLLSALVLAMTLAGCSLLGETSEGANSSAEAEESRLSEGEKEKGEEDSVETETVYDKDGGWTVYAYIDDVLQEETQYDEDGNLYATIVYTYSAEGQLAEKTWTRTTDGDVETLKYIYDENSNVIRCETYAADGELTGLVEYEYDVDNNPVKETNYDSNKNEIGCTEYEYGENGTLKKSTSYTNGAISELREYDSEGRETKCTQYFDEGGWVVYAYNANGSISNAQYYDENGALAGWAAYETDADGRILKESRGLEEGILSWYAEYTYNSDGDTTRVNYYDLDGFLLQWMEYTYYSDGMFDHATMYNADGDKIDMAMPDLTTYGRATLSSTTMSESGSITVSFSQTATSRGYYQIKIMEADDADRPATYVDTSVASGDSYTICGLSAGAYQISIGYWTSGGWKSDALTSTTFIVIEEAVNGFEVTISASNLTPTLGESVTVTASFTVNGVTSSSIPNGYTMSIWYRNDQEWITPVEATTSITSSTISLTSSLFTPGTTYTVLAGLYDVDWNTLATGAVSFTISNSASG